MRVSSHRPAGRGWRPWPVMFICAALMALACQPAAPSPTAAPAKPTEAPPKPAAPSPAASPSPSPSPSPAAVALTPASDAPGRNWPSYGGTLSNQRYSTLTQINTSNVTGLKGAWNFHIAYGEKASSFESTPVVIDGTMYLTSGRNDVWALNAKDGSKM